MPSDGFDLNEFIKGINAAGMDVHILDEQGLSVAPAAVPEPQTIEDRVTRAEAVTGLVVELADKRFKEIEERLAIIERHLAGWRP